MTVPPHLVTTSVRMEPPSRHPRPERRRRVRPHLVPAIVTVACVCTGFALVTAAVDRAPTPADVARSFVAARFDQDWEAVWELHCRTGRLPDRAAFVARMTALDQGFEVPASTAVVVEGVTEGAGPEAPAFTARVSIRAFDVDGAPVGTDTVQLPVVAEEGGFRVCLEPGWTP